MTELSERAGQQLLMTEGLSRKFLPLKLLQKKRSLRFLLLGKIKPLRILCDCFSNLLRGEPFDFFFGGGGGGRLRKKNSLQPPKEGKKIMRGKLRGKNIMHGLCCKKKFLQIIDTFQWIGWLVQIPACSVANLSAVFTSKLCSFI